MMVMIMFVKRFTGQSTITFYVTILTHKTRCEKEKHRKGFK